MKKNFDTILFDLDGTLLNSLGLWRQIDVDFLSKRNLLCSDEYIAAVGALSILDAAKLTKAKFNLPESALEIVTEWENMAREQYFFHIKPFDGVSQMLGNLKSKGYRLAVVTTLDRSLFEPCLRNNDILHFFEKCFSVNQVGRGKKFPDVYLFAMQQLNTQPHQCVIVEDVADAIKSAKSTGAFVIGALGEHTKDEKQQVLQNADVCVNDIREVEGVLV